MKFKSLIILILAFLAGFISCKRAPLSIGEIITESRELASFKEVHLNDNISMTLVRSDTCYIEITTGKNIIGNITTEVSNNVLTICNTCTLNWIRDYDFELHATLYYKDIKEFIFSSAGALDTKNPYNDTIGTYRFEIDGGSGDVDLLVNHCENFHVVYKYGTSRLNLHGRNNNQFNVYKRSYGILDAQRFQARNVDIENKSAGDCYIWSTDNIKATITNLGDIYYRGEPTHISVEFGEIARGRLIHID